MRFAIFPVHVSKVLRLPRKKWSQVIRSAAPVTQNHLSKPKDLILQNATLLRKSPPWPPNISDEHVSFIAPATRTASLRILFKCHTAAIVFEGATSPSCSAHFLTRCTIPCACQAQRHLNVQKCSVPVNFFGTFDFEMCFAPQRRAHFQHLNFQKCSENGVCCTLWLRNVLRATTSCTFSTSQLPKPVRYWGALYIFYFEMCFAPQRRVLFDISTSKSSLRPSVFYTFDFEMCFAPQRRVIFHLSSGQTAPHPPL